MASYAVTVDGVGDATQAALVRPGDSVDYTITTGGAMTATVVFEVGAEPSQNFEVVHTRTTVTSTAVVWNNDTDQWRYVRLRSTVHSGDALTATVNDVATTFQDAGFVDGVVYDADGLAVLTVAEGGITAGGTLAVTGATTLTGALTVNSSVVVDRVACGAAAVDASIQCLGNPANISGVAQRVYSATGSAVAAATTSLYGFMSDVSNFASAHTCALRAQFVSGQSAKGAGSTITSDVGFWSAIPNQGTENIAFLVGAAPAGSANWAFYAATNDIGIAAGRLAIGGAASANGQFLLQPTSAISGTTQIAQRIVGSTSNGATSATYGIYLDLTTAASAFTCTERAQIYAAGEAKGAGSTITSDIGIRVALPTSGTENVGLLMGAAPAGSTSYSIYSNSALLSHFVGIVNCAAGVRTKSAAGTFATDATPTEAELTSALGAPGTVGAGFVGIARESDTACHLAWTDGTSWFFELGTKAA